MEYVKNVDRKYARRRPVQNNQYLCIECKEWKNKSEFYRLHDKRYDTAHNKYYMYTPRCRECHRLFVMAKRYGKTVAETRIMKQEKKGLRRVQYVKQD